MEIINFINSNPAIFYGILFIDLALRGVALWKSARSNQKYWFFFLLVVNSMGILPTIYLGITYYTTHRTKTK